MGIHASSSVGRTIQRLIAPMPRCDDAEILDEAAHDPVELAENFRDIRRVNALLGGTSTVLTLLPRLMKHVPAGETVTILDLGTGCGDIPLAISRWAARRGTNLRIVASDFSEEVLTLAREQIGDHPDITFERYDARSVPLPDGTFDIVLCSLTLHHFPPDEAAQILREMDRLARVGFILNDLRRSRLGWVAAWVAARLTTRNRLTRNDAPLSVRRAYTPEELADLLRQAGITGVEITRRPWFRMAALHRKASHHA